MSRLWTPKGASGLLWTPPGSRRPDPEQPERVPNRAQIRKGLKLARTKIREDGSSYSKPSLEGRREVRRRRNRAASAARRVTMSKLIRALVYAFADAAFVASSGTAGAYDRSRRAGS